MENGNAIGHRLSQAPSIHLYISTWKSRILTTEVIDVTPALLIGIYLTGFISWDAHSWVLWRPMVQFSDMSGIYNVSFPESFPGGTASALWLMKSLHPSCLLSWRWAAHGATAWWTSRTSSSFFDHPPLLVWVMGVNLPLFVLAPLTCGSTSNLCTFHTIGRQLLAPLLSLESFFQKTHTKVYRSNSGTVPQLSCISVSSTM